MIYLIYGSKEYLINQEIKKIAKSFNNLNITKYNLATDTLSDVIEDCQTISLFEDKKLIICENAVLFTAETNKESENLEKYLNNYNPNTIIIFVVNKEKIDTRKKITKKIKEIGQIKECNEEINTFQFVKKSFKDYTISEENIKLLINRVGENTLNLNNEINKIKLYKENNLITKEDILNVSTKKIDTNIFKLIDYIIQNKKNNALEIYDEMLKTGEEPIKIIIMLGNQFRIMYQAKELLKLGYNDKDIAKILAIHPYRVKLALQNSKKYNSDILLKYLSKLADIDISIKTGKINKNIALEFFILNK